VLQILKREMSELVAITLVQHINHEAIADLKVSSPGKTKNQVPPLFNDMAYPLELALGVSFKRHFCLLYPVFLDEIRIFRKRGWSCAF